MDIQRYFAALVIYIKILAHVYENGYFFVITDFSADASGGLAPYIDASYSGDVRLELGFSQALPAATQVFIIGYQKKILEIDSDRRVTMNF